MKKYLLSCLILLYTISSYSQDSKFYLGVSLGIAAPGSDIGDEIKTGIDLNLINAGYRFNNEWGVTLNLISSGHVFDDDNDSTLGIAYFGIGPMYSLGLSEKIYWDIKPQLALGLTGKTDGTIIDDIDYKGSGFVIGNSFVIGDMAGFDFSINVDYFTGKFKEAKYGGVTVDLDSDNKISNFKLGLGVRYNF